MTAIIPENNMKFLKGGGEMGELIRSKDWSNSTVGSIENWSPSFRITLSIILNSKFPMFLFWGTELTCFYNDAFRPSLGNDGKHPAILGSRAEEYWKEIWSDIKPLIDNVFASGEASWSEDQLLPFYRNGVMEDIYWTFSNSPVYDESGKPSGVLVTCIETTKQVIALEKLNESQEKLNFAIDSANLGTWDLNPKTNRFIYNEQLRNWFGLSYSYEIDAPLAINSIAERDQQRTIDSMAAAMAPGSDGNYEIQHTVISPLDGTERIILAKGKVLFDENGVAYRFSGTGQDITQEFLYRKMEEEKNLFNKVILESNPDCVKIIDTDGRISYMNENGVCVLEGDNKSYFIDRKWESMWGIEEEIIVRDAVKRAFAGEKINFQASAITVKGNLKWWDVIVSALPDESGVVKDLLAVSRDITGIKNSEKDLEESEEQLRFALEGGNLGYFDSYPQKDIINWSDKTKEFFGIALDTTVNLEIYRNAIHPEDAFNALNQLKEALIQNEDRFYINEYRTAYTDKWLSVKGKIKPGKDAESVRITGIIQDITESKTAQKLLSESEHRFRNMIYTSPLLISILKGEDFIVEIANDAIIETWGKGKDVIGKRFVEVLPEIVKQGFEEILKQVYKTGIPFRAIEAPVTLVRNGITELKYFTFIYQAQRDANGDIESLAILATDVTQHAELNKKIQENENLLLQTKGQLELTFSNVPAGIFLYSNKKEILFANKRAANMLGYDTVEELLSFKNFNILMQKAGVDYHVVDENNEVITRETLPTFSTLKSGKVGEIVFSMQKKSGGSKTWYLNKSAPILDAGGKVSMVLTTSTDITAQKLAEETIRDSENHFRLLSDNAPMWVFITDLEINVLYANQVILKYIGLNHYSEFTGKVWYQVVHPEDINIVLENFQNSVVEQSNFDFEIRVLNAETEQYEWFYYKGITRYENEKFIGFIGTAININEQKTHLFALEESEQRFKYLVETLPQMVCVMDANGEAEYVTNKWEKYTGIKAGGKLKTWEKIVHPDDLDYSNSVWRDSLKSGNIYKFDLRLKSKEGEYRWFTVNGEPVFDVDNKIIKWVSAFTDVHTEKSFSQELEKQVTERTNELLISNELMLQKNDLLRISENFNRSLTDISPNIVYIHDVLQDKPFFLNSTYLTFTGYNWQQVKVLGNGFMREVIHPDDYDFLQETIEKIKTSKAGEIFEAKSQIKNEKGIWVPFLNRLTAFKRDNDQNVIQVIGVAIDISELKGAEKILEQKNDELLKMNKELESFAYVSSHDLQEPLRKIQTFTSRIMEKEYDNLSENGKNYLNRMRLAAERMQQLINDLLAYSRTKVQERKYENTDLSLIVKEVEDDLKDELAKKNGQIKIIDSYKADVIPFQFRQLMYNLVSNSIKFAKANEDLEVKVTFKVIKGIEANNDRLLVDKDYCHISVADNGIGFDSVYKDKIFEIFQRLHGREEYTGTGIGLAIVKKIVDNHNGIITANGELNKGATFDIYISV